MLFRLNRVFHGIIYQQKTLAVLAVAAIGTLAWLSPAHAGVIMDTVADLLSSIAQILIELIGKVFTVLIEILIAVVQYNGFINAPAVIKGWVLVRDISNMAFLIIFIAIAFATILGVEKYEYKQLLPKLLIMAVLINFSRTICGLVIDAAQVVMMTFVNGFKDVAAGNLIRGFGVSDMLTLRDLGETEGVSSTALAAASILAVAMLTIATVTVGIMVIMFIARIIYLWILIVLSPFAFVLSATPGFSGKFNDWWDKFMRYVFVGPLLAFFLWLSFSIMASVQPGQNLATQNNINFDNATHNLVNEETGEAPAGAVGRTSAAITEVSRSDNLLSFAIAIALLLMALTMANNIGVAGGKMAGTAMAKIQSGAIKLGKLGALGLLTGGVGLAAYGAYKGGRSAAGKWTGRRFEDYVSPGLTKWGAGKLSKATKAVGLGETRLGKFLEPIAEHGTRFGAIPKAWKNYKTRREAEKETGAVGAMEDAFYGGLSGRRTTRAEQSEAALVNQRAKELSETSKETNYFIQEFKRAHAAGDQIGMKAAIINLVNQNDQNSTLGDSDIAQVVMSEVQDCFKKLYGEKEGMDKYLEMYHDKDGKMPQTVADPTHWVEFMKHYFGNNSDTARFESVLSGSALEKGSTTFFGTSQLDAKTGKYNLRDLTFMTPDNPTDDPYRDGNFWRMQDNQEREAYIREHTTDPELAEKQVSAMNDFFGYAGAVLGKGRNLRGGDFQNFHPMVFNVEIDGADGVHGYAEQANPLGAMLTNQMAGAASERNFRGNRGDTTEANAGHHWTQGKKETVDALFDFYWRQARKLTGRAALHMENSTRAKYGLKELGNAGDPVVSYEVLEKSGILKLPLEEQKKYIRRWAEEAVETSSITVAQSTPAAGGGSAGAPSSNPPADEPLIATPGSSAFRAADPQNRENRSSNRQA